MAFVSGAYKAVYNAKELGLIEDGFTLNYRRSTEDIITDAGGDTPVDAVHRGVTASLSFVLSEWNMTPAGASGTGSGSAMKDLIWPFIGDDNAAALFGEMGRLGVLDSTMIPLAANPLILTACNTANNPATITFHAAILAPDFDVAVLFANRHRKVAVQMRLYPVLVTAATTGLQCKELKLFTTAAAA